MNGNSTGIGVSHTCLTFASVVSFVASKEREFWLNLTLLDCWCLLFSDRFLQQLFHEATMRKTAC